MNIKIQNFIEIPDLVTLGNLVCGFLSIIMAMNHDFHLSAIFMILALVFDCADGFVARQNGRVENHEFGKNIDSLSDIVSFGVAPAVFLYSFGHLNAPYIDILTIIASLFILICGVLRLTRYNILSDEIDGYVGFPIPGIAIIMASFFLTNLFNIYIAIIIAILISLVMISDIKYEKMTDKLILGVNCICLLLLILNLPVELFGINMAALVVLLTCFEYLISNIINYIR